MRRGQLAALVLAVMLAITLVDGVLLVATGRAATTTATSTSTSSSSTIDYQIPNGLCLSCYYAPDPSSRTYRKVPAGMAGAVLGSSLSNVGKQSSVLTNPVSAATGLVSSGVSGLVGGVAGDVMDQVTNWVVNGAKSVLGFVEKAATASTTPELSSGWFSNEFSWIVVYASGIAAIVALAGLISASIRHDPSALGHVLFGIGRAGLLTGMVVALTLLALAVVDGISGDIVRAMPSTFFTTLSGAWGTSGFGGLASSALAFLAALLEMGIALLLWAELIFRDAAIYLAVLFFPFTLAMAIWPRLAGAQAKLIRILATFIVFKPVALFTMMTGANILLGGVSLAGGVAPSVGTILSGLVVLALAAFAPWTLMHLLSSEVGTLSQRASNSRSASKSEHNTIIGGDLNAGSVTATSRASSAVGGASQGAGVGGGTSRHPAPRSPRRAARSRRRLQPARARARVRGSWQLTPVLVLMVNQLRGENCKDAPDTESVIIDRDASDELLAVIVGHSIQPRVIRPRDPRAAVQLEDKAPLGHSEYAAFRNAPTAPTRNAATSDTITPSRPWVLSRSG